MPSVLKNSNKRRPVRQEKVVCLVGRPVLRPAGLRRRRKPPKQYDRTAVSVAQLLKRQRGGAIATRARSLARMSSSQLLSAPARKILRDWTFPLFSCYAGLPVFSAINLFSSPSAANAPPTGLTPSGLRDSVSSRTVFWNQADCAKSRPERIPSWRWPR